MLRNRRTAIVAALVAMLAVLAVWRSPRAAPLVPATDAEGWIAQLLPRRLARAGPTPASQALATVPTQPAASPVGTPLATASPDVTAGADHTRTGQAQVVALAARAAGEYRDQAQYPPWSRPFNEEGEDPILRDRLVSPVTGAGPDGAQPILVVFPEQVSFEAPDAVLLYAYLSMNDARVPAASISGTITSEDLQPLAHLAYADDGTNGDRVAGDYLYSARFDAGVDFAPELSESFLVRVVAETTDGEPRMAATGFLYSSPHARLTGNYRDAIVDGSLAIDAEVEVSRAGRFHLEGTLYSADGQRAVGEAHTAGELGPGRHFLRLVFFGRIINQSEVDGPYLLRFVALSTTSGMPNAKNRLVTNAHLTAPYRFAQFSPEPFNDPDLLDAAERLERDLQIPPR
jgi:hypothetical protein